MYVLTMTIETYIQQTLTKVWSTWKSNKHNKSPPRPPNSFILYRKNLQFYNFSQLKNSDVSKKAAFMWHHETEEIRSYYKNLANLAKSLHKITFPEYKYCPIRKKKKIKEKNNSHL